MTILITVHDFRHKNVSTLDINIPDKTLLCELIEDTFNIKDAIYAGHTPTVLVNKKSQDENYELKDKDVVKIKPRPKFTF